MSPVEFRVPEAKVRRTRNYVLGPASTPPAYNVGSRISFYSYHSAKIGLARTDKSEWTIARR